MKLTGRVQGTDGATQDWSQWTVVFAFESLATFAGDTDEDEDDVTIPVVDQRETTPSASGEFDIDLPEELVGMIRAHVRSPLGDRRGASEWSVSAAEAISKSQRTITFKVPVLASVQVVKSDDPFLGRRIKLQGRVIDENGNDQVADRQVLIYAVRADATTSADGNEAPATVQTTGRTDARGYFSAEYPRILAEGISTPARFVEGTAYALVSGCQGQDGATRLPIRLTKLPGTDATTPGGYLPRNIVLVVRCNAPKAPDGVPDDCGCHALVPRTPDPEDFARASGVYSVDLGGGGAQCPKLTAPNRALEEFSFYTVVRSTDPDITGALGTHVVPHTLPAAATRVPPQRNTSTGPATKRGAPTIVPPPPTRGAVIVPPPPRRGSPTSAPPRTVTSAPVGSSKAVVAGRIAGWVPPPPADGVPTTTATRAALNLTSLQSRVTNRWLQDAAKQIVHATPGRAQLSANNQIEWDTDSDFYAAITLAYGHILHFKQVWRADGYSLGDLLYSLPLAPGQKKQIAVVDWEQRQVSERTESTRLDEGVQALLSRDRDINEIVGTSLKEHMRGESTNLTMGAGQGSGAAGSGSYGGASVGAVSAMALSGGYSKSTAEQDAARSLTAQAQQRLRDTTFQAASAVRSLRSTVIQTVSQRETVTVTTEVVANHNHCHAMTIEYFEVLRHFLVTNELASVRECLYVPLPLTEFTIAKALKWRDVLFAFLRKAELGASFDAMARVSANWHGSNVPDGQFADAPLRFFKGTFRIEIRVPAQDEPGLIERVVDGVASYLLGSKASDQTLVPRPALAAINGVQEIPLGAQFSLVSRPAEGRSLLMTVRAISPPSISRRQVEYIKLKWQPPITDFPEGTKILVQSGSMRYQTAFADAVLFDDAGIFAGLDVSEVLIPTPLSGEELRNPREEDLQATQVLLEHLNAHLEYYHKVIWWHMDADRRFMLLDGIIEPYSGRSVASVVENRLIGFVGNSLVMPVAPGYRLNPKYAEAVDENGLPIDMRNLFAADPAPPMRVSVPTRGVFAEAIMGECNSCEHKDELRFWRWDEAPTGDEPTPIQSPLPALPEPRKPEGMAPTPFAAPIVNIQSPPAAPDPTGLAAALQVIGNADAFRDITGLTQTQLNALEALKTTMETVRHMGSQAANLAQSAGGRDVDKTLQSIKQAKDNGLIDDGQAKDLAHTKLKQDAGAETAPTLTQDPAVKQTIESAARSDDSNVKVTSGGETVEVAKKSTPATGRRRFNVRLRLLDHRGRPMTGTWVVMVDNKVVKTFESDGQKDYEAIAAQSTASRPLFSVRGNPFLQGQSLSSLSPSEYVYTGQTPIQATGREIYVTGRVIADKQTIVETTGSTMGKEVEDLFSREYGGQISGGNITKLALDASGSLKETTGSTTTTTSGSNTGTTRTYEVTVPRLDMELKPD